MAWRISGEEERTGARRAGVKMSVRDTSGREGAEMEGMFCIRLRRWASWEGVGWLVDAGFGWAVEGNEGGGALGLVSDRVRISLG